MLTRPKYNVELTASAARSLKKLERRVQVRIAHVIDSLAIDPRPDGAVKLSGADDLYRVRTGDYRVIYTIRDEKLIVLIVLIIAISHRREIYRK